MSVRMRASSSGRHLSGAERLVPTSRVAAVVQELSLRALSRQAAPDQIVITVDALSGPVRAVRSLDLISHTSTDPASCRESSIDALRAAGIADIAITTAFELLDARARTSSAMRGAIIMDAANGRRLEPDRERGVRASRFDWSDDAAEAIDRELSSIGLTHFRTREAIAVATKAALAPGMLAELCWSDDPDYIAGYVAVPGRGYLRYPAMKQEGSPSGGRVFFVNAGDLDLRAFIAYLEREPVLITTVGSCRIE